MDFHLLLRQRVAELQELRRQTDSGGLRILKVTHEDKDQNDANITAGLKTARRLLQKITNSSSAD